MNPLAASTVCHAFAENASRAPERSAVQQSGADSSYADLWRQAQALARYLREQGIEAGDRVGLLAPNSVRYVACYLGIQSARGVVVSLNPETSARELRQTLVHCEPRVVIAEARCSISIAEIAAELTRVRCIVWLDSPDEPPAEIGVPSTTWDAVTAGTSEEVPILSRPDDLAQIIYTSGTTGRPKGVMLTHANILANCRSIVTSLTLTAADSVFVVLPFFYSYGNSLLFTHLAVGGRLVLTPDFVFWNRALEVMRDQQATGLAGVPTTFAMLFQRSKFAQMSFPHLRYLTCAGGALSADTTTRLRTSFPQSELFIMYGQTEATARLSILGPHELIRKPGSIGRGIAGVRLTLCDETGAPVEPGTVGEITATGPNIMQGYWNDPQATSDVLTPHGLRTGDLAHADHEGYLYIVGRHSDMIKQGAHRISPQEIEEALLEVPGIVEAAVIGLPDEILGELICAYVVCADCDQRLTADAIFEHCRHVLPRYKQVKRVTFVASLPRTASGKIRRSALRELPLSEAASAGGE